jgi:hypothetical protein
MPTSIDRRLGLQNRADVRYHDFLKADWPHHDRRVRTKIRVDVRDRQALAELGLQINRECSQMDR